MTAGPAGQRSLGCRVRRRVRITLPRAQLTRAGG